MGNYQLRLGSTLTFDTEREKEIIDCIDKLSQSHRLGNFISHLLRLAFESPEEFGNGKEVQKLICKMTDWGMSPTRYNFFSQVAKETEAMKKKVDELYNLAYKTYMLAQAGKRIGIESKADNLLMATFVIERQLSELCRILGVDGLKQPYASTKLDEVHERADEVLEFIIESYDSILNELKDSFNTISIQPISQVVPVTQANEPTVESNYIDSKLVGDSKSKMDDTSEINMDDNIEIVLASEPEKKDESIYIDKLSGNRAKSFMDMLDD